MIGWDKFFRIGKLQSRFQGAVFTAVWCRIVAYVNQQQKIVVQFRFSLPVLLLILRDVGADERADSGRL
jgi:hypothetical protein